MVLMGSQKHQRLPFKLVSNFIISSYLGETCVQILPNDFLIFFVSKQSLLNSSSNFGNNGLREGLTRWGRGAHLRRMCSSASVHLCTCASGSTKVTLGPQVNAGLPPKSLFTVTCYPEYTCLTPGYPWATLVGGFATFFYPWRVGTVVKSFKVQWE